MVAGGSYFQDGRADFTLFAAPGRPRWRPPQLGALGALAAHWSTHRSTPALISLPTGTGKTGVATAVPHLLGARRVLVVVPSTELRRQLAAAFRNEDVLLVIGALTRQGPPEVKEVSGVVSDWDELRAADVVVALPNSISPSHYPNDPPPSDLFDLIVVDEAHHAPAPTWMAILEHFSDAKAVLLTATPRRRDGQRLPGDHAYHYPLRQALDEGIFKPIDARVLDVPNGAAQDAIDAQIVDAVCQLIGEPAHASSTLLVRAGNRGRAADLAALYEARGITVAVLHSGLSQAKQKEIVADLRAGKCKAVAVVGMLIEGFDLPSLRIVAYHDKHKSLPTTAQLIGRLARVDSGFPQPSVLVTARDVDVFPELRGVVRQLYEEDADWTVVLPGIIDDEIAEAIADRQYARGFAAAPAELSVEAIHPLRRSLVFEISAGPDVLPAFDAGAMPAALQAGQLLRGATITYSDLNSSAGTAVLVTMKVARPRWHNDAGLDAPNYDLHLVSYRRSAQTHLPSLVFINSGDGGVVRELQTHFGLEKVSRAADPTRLQDAFDSLERLSVSSIGVRNNFLGRGTATYRMFAGSGVDRGLRESDTNFACLGHAMIQVPDSDGAFTAGVSTGKGKYWETRYAPLRSYDSFITDLADRYWFPPAAPSGQLLPQVSRGRRLLQWPASIPVAAEVDFALIGRGWIVEGHGPIEILDLRAREPGSGGSAEQLPLQLFAPDPQGERVVWEGHQDVVGNVVTDGTADVIVRHGFASATTVSELLTARPPTIYFLNGQTVRGGTVFDSRAVARTLPSNMIMSIDWPGVDIRAETRASAASRGLGCSIHELLEGYLRAQRRRAKHRWILGNDGSGEMADYLVLEIERGRVLLDLWHAKFAHGNAPAIRVTDFQEVVAQAIKSRRWLTDAGFWAELLARMTGRSTPRITIIEGSERLLRIVCGSDPRFARLSYDRLRPIVTGKVGVAQPGLSCQLLEAALTSPPPTSFTADQLQSATQIRDLLGVLYDAVAGVHGVAVIGSV